MLSKNLKLKKKVAILVGHSLVSQGAVNYDGITEFTFNCGVASLLKIELDKFEGIDANIFVRKDGSWSQDSSGLENYNPSICIELHFNSASVKAQGCEAIVWKNSPNYLLNVKFADIITDYIAKEYQIKQRNVIQLDQNSQVDGVLIRSEGRGVNNLKNVFKHESVEIATIIEPCFGNYKTRESEEIFLDPKRYANTLASAIAVGFLDRNRIVSHYLRQDHSDGSIQFRPTYL